MFCRDDNGNYPCFSRVIHDFIALFFFFLVCGKLLKCFVFYFYAPNGVFYALFFGDFFGFFAEILQIFWFLMTFYGFLRGVLAATYKKTDLLTESL